MQAVQRVLITGVSSGLGEALMRECLAAGYEVTGVVRRDEQKQALEAAHATGLAVEVADLAQPAAVTALLERVAGRRFDYVVLNAGCADVGAFAELPDDSIDSVMQTNLLCNMQIVRALIPGALEAGTKFVFVSSVCARLPGIQFASYAVSKAGLTQLYKSLAVEYPQLDFLCLELGGMQTPFHEKAGYTEQRKRKSADEVARRMHRSMLKDKGLRTLAVDWWLMRRVLMTFEDSVVGALRWKQAKSR